MTPPSSVNVVPKSSTSWRVNWNHVSGDQDLKGIRVGYEIKYAMKSSSPKNWTSQFVEENVNVWTATSLEEYTEYEVKVAARTSKGSGVFSSPITVRTHEDSKLANFMLLYISHIISRFKLNIFRVCIDLCYKMDAIGFNDFPCKNGRNRPD